MLEASGVRRTFRQGPIDLEVLQGVNLAVREPANASRSSGPPGPARPRCCRSWAGWTSPAPVRWRIAGNDIHALAEKPRGELRNRTLGFIYQFHHLLPEFSALENVAMPLLVRREPKQVAEQRARAILERVGLGERLIHRPQELSGGERQRAAVARALVTNPRIVLADEPTGNLDGGNAESVFALMLELNREFGTSLIVVTHDRRLASRMDRILELDGGNLVEKT